mmetsp:Transcript_93606/g.185692  ORF Transcript_93606/g.185692 Transcript_93606/m.185692 type:complete len:540 (+) Transcript_93606:48-1667(+)|eukprot:CAMPEP_0172665704 /NCGR_PEP_ID=MMETSP1074-20121228/7407_1 /TAXON_ID=2916 /ORGANISM="Ceratium fusus, Strain PA161109" /LENGTH=539 /DNA_ID=CAMNT_0013482045 /DNA_START=47 /DNA_END=1666 /DNA_ORIENTATION=-
MTARSECMFMQLRDDDQSTRCSGDALPWPAWCPRLRIKTELLLGLAAVFTLAAFTGVLKPWHLSGPPAGRTTWQSNLAVAPTKSQRAAGSGVFLQISDIHLDPWYDGSLSRDCFCNRFGLANISDLSSCRVNSTQNRFGQRGCDTPYALLQSTLAAAAANAPKGGYDWIFVTGDYVRHFIENVPTVSSAAAVREVIQTVGGLIRSHFPETAVHHGVARDVYLLGDTGNNDFPGDYNVTVTDPNYGRNPWFASLVPMLLPQRVADDHGVSQRSIGGNAQDTFSRGGYFAEHLTANLCVLSINTAVYSKRHKSNDPFGQFKWLRSVMKELRAGASAAGAASGQRRAIIVGHIPPVIDHYKFESLWEASYVRSYLEIVSTNSDLIAGQLFAHMHTPMIRLLPSQFGALPVFIAGGVSPVFENNPSFRVWRYSGSQLLDYTDVYGDLREEGPQDAFNFDAHLSALETFNLSSLAAEEWQEKVMLKLETNDEVWRRYIKNFYLTDKGQVFEAAVKSPIFRAKATCSMANIHQLEFHQCLARRGI